MKLLNSFDSAIAELDGLPRGYCINGITYDCYLRNDVWEKFVADMDTEHRRQFGYGSGSELTSKNHKPPKMASFASSSRMIYRLSESVPNFIFEKKMPTTIGGTANLDGYLALPGQDIYVEAKCREPYNHASVQIIKQNYREIYTYLCEMMPDTFSCLMQNIPESSEIHKRCMNVHFYCKKRAVIAFDIKQMICHLLAVATSHLRYPSEKQILFLYLLYDPSLLLLSDDNKAIVHQIHSDVCWAAENFEFPQMFSHIVDFLSTNYNFSSEDHLLKHLKNSFHFQLCNQHDFLSYLR